MRLPLRRSFLTAVFTGLAFATAAGAARADSMTLDASQVAAIDKIARAEVDEKRTPSIAIAVVRGNDIVYEKAFGFRDPARKLPATPQTVYAIGSITKQMTAAGILLLARDGKLSLDDKLSTYIPEFAYADRVTLRQLLNQTSGLPQYVPATGDDEGRVLGKPAPLSEHMRVAASRSLMSEPGARFEYNNLNYFLLGEVIARVSKESYATFVHDRIFAPLHMTSTSYYFANVPDDRRAVGYSGTSPSLRPALLWDPTWALGAGAITSTVHDLALWDIGFSGILGNDATAQMLTVPATTTERSEYAMGWVVGKPNGRLYVWHNGEIGGFHAMNAWYPEQQLRVIVLTNVDSLVATNVTQPEAVAQMVAAEVIPTDVVVVDPKITARAKEWIGRLARGDIDATQLTPQMATALTPDVVKSVDVGSFGQLVKLVPTAVDTQGNVTIYSFRATFERNSYIFLFALTPDGKIAGLRFTP